MTPTPILLFSQWLLETLSWLLLVASLIFCFRRRAASYMRSFPWYCIGNCLPALVTRMWAAHTGLVIYVFTIFELCYFTYFFSRILLSKRTKAVLWSLTSAVLLYAIFRLFARQVFNINLVFVVLESFILIAASLYYFRQLFITPIVVNLFEQPSYWMTTGVLFYFVLLIPTLCFANYFYDLHNRFMGDTIYSVNSYAQVVSYGLYFKAMTCSIPKP